MRANRVRCCLLLAATVLFTGCLQEYNLVGRWDAGNSSFHFRKDGLLFYLTSSKVRYQGRYTYDDSTDPGLVRAELKSMDDKQSSLSLTLLVSFLGPDRIRLESANPGRKRTVLAARMMDAPRKDDTSAAP